MYTYNIIESEIRYQKPGKLKNTHTISYAKRIIYYVIRSRGIIIASLCSFVKIIFFAAPMARSPGVDYRESNNNIIYI